jgi:hypothetical protein
VTVLRRIAYSRIAGLWSLPHLTGEASGQSPIRPQSPHGAGRTANTRQDEMIDERPDISGLSVVSGLVNGRPSAQVVTENRSGVP